MAGRKSAPTGAPYSNDTTSPVFALHEAGIHQTKDGGLTVGPEALRAIRDRRIREHSTPTVPSTQRWINRDGGGVGVRKGQGRWEQLQLETLRDIRERSPLVQVIHRARHKQIKRLAQEWSGKRGEVGWRVVHKDHLDQQATPPAYIKPYIATFQNMLRNPSPRYCKTTGEFLALLEEDYLTINRPVVEKLFSDLDPSVVVGFRPVDGAMIWPTLRFLEEWTTKNPGWRPKYKISEDEALDILSNKLSANLHTAECCAVRDGILEATYEPGRLIIGADNTRTDIRYAGYPPSHVEEAAEVILGFMNTWEYNAAYFTRGMLAEFILGVTGNVSDDDIDAFVDMLRMATQGKDRAWQPPVMPLPENGAIEKIDLKSPNKDMGFETWMSLLFSLCCANYRMDPSTVNGKPWDAGGGSSLGAPNREKEISLAKEEGLQADMMHLKEAFLDPLAQEVHPDLRVIAEYGDFDPMKEAQVYEIRSKVDMTRNEVRLANGMSPMGLWLSPDDYEAADDEQKKKFDDNPWNMPADTAFAQMVNQAKMREQMEQQQAQGQPDGFGGADQPGDGDGFGGKAPQFPFGQPPGAGGAPKPPGPGAAPGGPQAGAAPAPAGPPMPKPPAAPMAKASSGQRVTIYVEDGGGNVGE